MWSMQTVMGARCLLAKTNDEWTSGCRALAPLDSNGFVSSQKQETAASFKMYLFGSLVYLENVLHNDKADEDIFYSFHK